MFELGSCVKFKEECRDWLIPLDWNLDYIYVIMPHESGKYVIYKDNIYIPYASHRYEFLFVDYEVEPYVMIEWEEVV